MTKTYLTPFVIVSMAFVSTSCGKTDDSDPSSSESVSEVAGSAVSGVANETDGGSLSFNDSSTSRASAFLAALERLLPVRSALASGSCPTVSMSACNGGAIHLGYSACQFGKSSALWNGSETLTFTSGVCSTSNPLANGNVIVRTFSPGTTRTGANGVVVAFNSSSPKAYDGFSGSGGISVASVGGNRNMTVKGIQYSATKTAKGITATVWDHTLSSAPDAISITGSGTGRTVSGSLTIRHNLAKYKGQVTINGLGYASDCCHPTSGTITTVLSGSKSGTETIAYGSCGTATLTDSNGVSRAITLNHCL